MVNLRDNIWAVKVPEDAQVYIVPVNADRRQYELTCNDVSTYLPIGTWHFLFTTDNATEEDARKVVEPFEVANESFYKNYSRGNAFFISSIYSLRSLLQVKGCEGNWAVLEKK